MNLFDDDSNFLYILKNMGVKVKINGTEEQMLISNYKDKIIDYKKIKGIVKLNCGDLISYQNRNWLVIGEVSQNGTIYKATMRKCNHILKFYVMSLKIFEVPCILEVSGQSINEGKYFTTANGKIELYIRDIPDHRKLTYNNRFILMGSAFEIEGLTREIPGIIHLYCRNILSMAQDDLVNEIAYNPPSIPNIPIPPIPQNNLIVKGEDKVVYNRATTYTVLNADKTPTDKTFTFSLENNIVDAIVLATIKSFTDTTVTLLGNNKTKKGVFDLKCVCNEDNTITVIKNLKVGSLMSD
ncbi:hypothetical protein [Clostridium tagluense]|uniref:hypothetical protein n=1 Tax=Clostridium tagluense TaxID=360422 RepID=UPI001C6F4654|nr:hypothetical protein [Clostridium tagluense]MBW9157803.1 hypothetical protein [Clostridium tagluense]WLC63778.1 hypothetical protein KTC93_12875 [Clostridium tagluense]